MSNDPDKDNKIFFTVISLIILGGGIYSVATTDFGYGMIILGALFLVWLAWNGGN